MENNVNKSKEESLMKKTKTQLVSIICNQDVREESLKEKITNLEKLNELNNITVNQLHDSLDDCNKQIDALKATVAEKDIELAKKENELSEALADKDTYKSEVVELKNQIKSNVNYYKDELDVAVTSLSNAKNTINKLNGVISSTEVENTRLRKEIKKLNHDGNIVFCMFVGALFAFVCSLLYIFK